MQKTSDLRKTTDFLCFVAETTQSLSNESIEKLFSPDTLEKVSQCKSSLEFLELIQSLGLTELKSKDFTPRPGDRTESLERLDTFFSTGNLPADEQMSDLIDDLQKAVRKSFTDHVADGAMAGAAVGAAAGAVGGGLVTSPVGGVGASVGAMAGAVAGAVGGAIGGAINWGLGRE